MGKQDSKNRQLADQQRGMIDSSYGDFMSGLKSRNTGIAGRADDLYKNIYDKYSNSNNFMPAGMKPGANGFFDTSGFDAGGGVPDYSASKAGYQKMADTGGINRGDFEEAKNSFSNFIKTGGLGADEAANIRYRATSQIPTFYNNLKQGMARRANVQGGYSPGFDAQNAELARQAGRESYGAARTAEADIADRMQQGREFGTTGSANLAGTINQMEQQGKLAGLGGLKDITTSEGSFGESAANRRQQLQMALLDQYQRGGLASASGLQDLYSSAPGELGQYYSTMLNGLNSYFGNRSDALNQRKTSDTPSVWGKVGKAALKGAALAAAASDRNIKENIEPVSIENVIDKFNELQVSTWNYIGDPTRHLGPMAQDMKRIFNVGDGEVIHLVDVCGIMMLLGKALAHNASKSEVH